jgi:hypothetical protein
MPREKTPLHDREELEGVLLADGLDDAFIGTAWRKGIQIAVYSAEKCVEVFMRDGCSEEEAWEYFSFNTEGAWVGDETPVFVYTRGSDDEEVDV